jgi:N-acetylneuraminic acid mutarotase
LKISRIILTVVVIAIIGIIALLAYETFVVPATTTSSSSVWLTAEQYPIQEGGIYAIAGQQCVNSTSYIYCIGGIDVNGAPRDSAYISSSLSTSPNITTWTDSSNAYPQNINGQSCLAYSSYIYCVGGSYDSAGDDNGSSYYAALNSNGTLGTWISTTSFPIPVDSQSCVTSSSHIYCIGGENETDGEEADTSMSTSVWYAELSSSGIGTWQQTTSYPTNVYFATCVAFNNYIYCLGGYDSNGNVLNSVYYASLSPSGVGSWTTTTSYPSSLYQEYCVISSGTIYCVGGGSSSTQDEYTNAVYYATVSSSGIGSWKKAANYPDSLTTDCVTYSSYIYCVGGFDSSSNQETSSVYYASLASLSG